MSAQPSSHFQNKKNASRKTSEKKSLFNRIDYFGLAKKSIEIVWNFRKLLIMTAILIVLTGGQAITFRSSFWGSSGGGDFSNFQAKNESNDWQKNLDNIETQQQIESKISATLNDRNKVNAYLKIAGIVAAIIMVCAIITFLLNSYFHAIFLRHVYFIDQDSPQTTSFIKNDSRGLWKKVVWLRVIFWGLYLLNVIIFLTPPIFFAIQKSWGAAIITLGSSVLILLIIIPILGYIFRYSLFYLVESKLSARESVDRGYDLFFTNWKESIVASVLNIVISLFVGIFEAFFLMVLVIVLVLVAGIIGGVFYVVLGPSLVWPLIIMTGIILVLTPLLLVAIIISAFWQSFVIVFWYLLFKELAGLSIAQEETAKEKVLDKKVLGATKPIK